MIFVISKIVNVNYCCSLFIYLFNVIYLIIQFFSLIYLYFYQLSTATCSLFEILNGLGYGMDKKKFNE
jgi:hypothetical protein